MLKFFIVLFTHIVISYSELSIYIDGDICQFKGKTFPSFKDGKLKLYGKESLIAITDGYLNNKDFTSNNSGFEYLNNGIKYTFENDLSVKTPRGNEVLISFIYEVSNCTFKAPIYDQEYGVSLALSNPKYYWSL